ncbi:MAG: 4-(cytidine 5'-diphospho)-2-C-methyl-D-erythritol kinase [Pseudorhodoplanes sp.]|uniref:4-(cytidine 5'-diphospho)-2-C-methyl-D-erythritol kinase n=1 Tax=Pseudorhodoplanes sp. TaxID=1934341 RepID=UPI003D134BF3
MRFGSTGHVEFAPAKINLTLRVGQRRPDGYHALESLVAFAHLGDELRLVPGGELALSLTGETASHAGPRNDNLVLKAARALLAEIADPQAGHFHLTKQLPVAAGLGGGSSDAAAALRLIARINDLPAQDPRVMAAARTTGADVPVCLDRESRIMRGIGEILSTPLRLPTLHAVLANPGVPVPTAAVFGALARSRDGNMPPAIDDDPATRLLEAGREPAAGALIDALASSANDLERPAIALFPAVGETLDALRASRRCGLARMSGSGGTCFGLFGSAEDTKEAAARLAREHPDWWVRETILGAAPVQ